MRHLATRRRRSRGAAGPLATVGLLAAASLLAFGAGTSAHAADPLPVTITGQDHVALALDGPAPEEPQVTLHLKTPGDEVDEGEVPVVHRGDYSIRIDASELAGVASARLPDCPAQDGDPLIVVCSGSELYQGEWPNRVGDIRLTAGDDSAAGDFGTIHVTGEGAGLAFTPLDIDVLVGGARYLNHRVHEPAGFQPGDTFAAPIGFRNTGGIAGHGAVLRIHGSRGLSFPDSYGNCSYQVVDDGPLLDRGTEALCTFDGTFEPGSAYETSEPLKVKAADFALLDVFTYGFSAVSPQQARELLASGDYTPGTGPDLTLRPATGTSPGDYAQYVDIDLPTHGPSDFALTGDSLKGAAGDTVTAKVGFRNGPTWVSALRSGGEPLHYEVQAPEGATLVGTPSGCFHVDELPETGGAGYVCPIPTPILEDASATYSFTLRIDKVVPDAKGKLYLPTFYSGETDTANNTAWLVLNATEAGTDGGSGAAGGATGGQSADGGAGSTGGTSPEGGATTAAGQGGGGLASTGLGGILLTSGGAVLALGLGTALYLRYRRRTATASAAPAVTPTA